MAQILKKSFVFLCLLNAGVLADTITLMNGKVLQDKRIRSFTIKELVYKDGRREKKIPSYLVREVKPSNYPRKFKMGMEQEENGEIDTAIEFYRAFGEKTSPKSPYAWLRQFALWRVAMLIIEGGTTRDWLDGIAEIENMLKLIPDSKFLYDYYKLKFFHYLDIGDEKAKSNITVLIKNWISRIRKNGYPENYLYDAMLDEVLVERDLLRKMTPMKAYKRIKEILAMIKDRRTPAFQRAQVELGWALGSLGKWEEARPYFEEGTQTPMVDDITRARAWLGLGHTFYNKKGRKPEDCKVALLDYMRVVINFEHIGEKTDWGKELIAQALFFAEKAYKEWGGPQWQEGCLRLKRKRKSSKYRTTTWGRR